MRPRRRGKEQALPVEPVEAEPQRLEDLPPERLRATIRALEQRVAERPAAATTSREEALRRVEWAHADAQRRLADVGAEVLQMVCRQAEPSVPASIAGVAWLASSDGVAWLRGLVEAAPLTPTLPFAVGWETEAERRYELEQGQMRREQARRNLEQARLALFVVEEREREKLAVLAAAGRRPS